jgi:hypothetical protein
MKRVAAPRACRRARRDHAACGNTVIATDRRKTYLKPTFREKAPDGSQRAVLYCGQCRLNTSGWVAECELTNGRLHRPGSPSDPAIRRLYAPEQGQ